MEDISNNEIENETDEVLIINDDVSMNDISGNLINPLNEYVVMATTEVVDYSDLLTDINDKLTFLNNLVSCLTFFFIGVWLWKKARSICFNCFGGEKNYE